MDRATAVASGIDLPLIECHVDAEANGMLGGMGDGRWAMEEVGYE